MKGRISEALSSILRSPKARKELRAHLIHGRDGRVELNGVTYRIRIDVMEKITHAPPGGRLAETR